MNEGAQVYSETRQPAEQLASEIDRLNRLLQAGAIDGLSIGYRTIRAAPDPATGGRRRNIMPTTESKWAGRSGGARGRATR
jgi:hypothetical protein